MYIPGRERKVIELLLHAEEDMTVKEVAKTLEVSERTIHRDLKNIETIISPYRLELMKKTGVGLRISGERKDKEQLALALSVATAIDFTSEERQAIILATLFETNDPIKLFTLANELNVTIATISNDLTQLEIALTSFHLTLVRKRGFGVKIEGNEADKRAAISNLITQYVDPFDFVSLLKENIQKKSKPQPNAISNRLLGFVNPESLRTIEKRVEKTREALPYELADSAHIGLVVHLALAIERLQKGDTITFDSAHLKQIEGTKEFHIAKGMIEDLEIALNMDIPEDEIGYITMHLLGAKLRVHQHDLLEDSSFDVAYKAKALIQYISEDLGVDLTEKGTLLNDLVTHLKPAIYRLEQRMKISNPLIKEIMHDYDDLFHLVKEGVRETFPGMAFPDDEIGYLVLHFAAVLLHDEKASNLKALVICSSGIGTAKILATKLMQRVPEITQVDNRSMFDTDLESMEAYDIIVSTIPLHGYEGTYVLASPMLTQAEVNRIKKAIRQKKLTYKKLQKESATVTHENLPHENFTQQLEAIQNYTGVILDLLKALHVIEMATKDSMADNLRSICDQLEKDQNIVNKENVLIKLLKREKLSGLGIPNTSLALYHTRSSDVIKPSFTVYRLNKPLPAKGMDGTSMEVDTLLVMLAPEIAHQEALEILSYVSSLVIQDQASTTLFESGSETQLKQFLSEQLHKLLQDKNLL